MFTKVRAARLASRSGAATVVAAGAADDVIAAVISGADLGTYFLPDVEPLVARKRWLAGQLQVKGCLVLDAVRC
jgi:glutamate 5-kinase